MFSVVISEKGGEQRRLEFEKAEVNIGRVQGNDIILPKGNVSKRHSRIVLKDGKFIIVDLKSTNGTYVNGRKITSPMVVRGHDKVYIGDFILHVQGEGAEAVAAVGTGAEVRRTSPPPPPKRKPRPTVTDEAVLARPGGEGDVTERPLFETSTRGRRAPSGKVAPSRGAEAAEGRRPRKSRVARRSAPESPRAPAGDPRTRRVFELQKEIHDRLIEHMDLRRLDIEQLADEELWEKTEHAIADIVESMDGQRQIPSSVDQDTLIKDVLNEALGLGPLEDLLAEQDIDEIMVNRADQIYVERAGRLEATDKGFSSDKAVLGVIERIVAPLGRRIDEASPLVDARLKDGSRVNAVIPPLAIKGPTITIRKFRRDMLSADDLIKMGSITPAMMAFLDVCVTERKNVVISGGTGSGKTTTLNVLSNTIPEDERILTIEDAAELQLKHEHWIQLEGRPPNIEGRGEIAIRDLVRNSLRMRPDRVIVGECRGGEALDMLQAMNTGHDGSLTTAHSNGPRDTLARLETMVLMAGMELPIRAIREQIASAIDIIVHQSRFSDGSRRVTHISEVTAMEGDVITMQDIFLYKQEGFDEEGRVQGRFVPSGFVPRFYEDLQQRGISVNMSVFRE